MLLHVIGTIDIALAHLTYAFLDGKDLNGFATPLFGG